MLSMTTGPTIVVANGATDSPPVIMDATLSDADTVGFLSPAVLAEVATLQLSPDFDINYRKTAADTGKTEAAALAAAISAATWVTADATNAALGTAGQYSLIRANYLVCLALRIHLNGAAAASRTFKTNKRLVVQ